MVAWGRIAAQHAVPPQLPHAVDARCGHSKEKRLPSAVPRLTAAGLAPAPAR